MNTRNRLNPKQPVILSGVLSVLLLTLPSCRTADVTKVIACNTPTMITGGKVKVTGVDRVPRGANPAMSSAALVAEVESDAEAEALRRLNKRIAAAVCPSACTEKQRISSVTYSTTHSVKSSSGVPYSTHGDWWLYITVTASSSASQQIQCVIP